MSDSSRVIFQPMGIAVKADTGKSVLEIAADHQIPIRSDCGGKGVCGKCLVAVSRPDHLSPPTDKEMRVLKDEQIAEDYRLACQAILQGPVNVTIPKSSLDNSEAGYKTGISGTFSLSPMVKRHFLPLSSSASLGDDGSMDIAGHILKNLEGQQDPKVMFDHLPALRSISRPFAYRKDLTLSLHQEKGITAVFDGDKKRSLGVAIDIGTTTLAAYLCDLTTGRILTSASAANPQRRYGEDVISRISYANENPTGGERLARVVAEGINQLIEACLQTADAEKGDVDDVVVVGNTTMQQAFAGLHLSGLGFSPYFPVSRILPDMTALSLGLDLHSGVHVHFLPMISGFVGGDTMGVILTEKPHERDEISLIIDIGTNGELVLGNKNGLWVTSCATGPALEGAHIECGMRASTGAIDKLRIDPETYAISYEFIGSAETERPRGLCGSAIIDAAAEMLRAGIILSSGRLKEGFPGVTVDEKGIGRKFTLVPAGQSKQEPEVYVSLGDIRQIQLAKGALSTGIKLLMRAARIDRVDRMVLTGAFGARFDWRNAVAIGMLLDSKLFGRVEIVENAAGTGAIKALLDRNYRQAAKDLLPTIRTLELGEEKDFPTEFALSMAFPSQP